MVSATVIAAATASTLLGGMYLDAKLALSKDVNGWIHMRKIEKLYLEAVQKNRLSLYYLFEDSVKRRLNHECIWSREGCFTWSQTYYRVNQYGNWFLSQGVQPREYVAFYLTNSPDLIFAWLGLWSIGAAPAMINYNLFGDALLHCLRISGASMLLLDKDEKVSGPVQKVREHIEKIGMVMLGMDEVKSMVSKSNSERPGDTHRMSVKGDWPIAMFYTSGTTGLPKGVAFTVERGYRAGLSLKVGSITNDDDRWYNCMPLYHATGGITAISSLTNGFTFVIGKKFSTSQFWLEVHDSRATWITYVGETARYLLAAAPSPLDKSHNVKSMFGNGLRPDVWHKFRERFNIESILEFFSSSEGVFNLMNHCRGDYLATAVGHHGALTRALSRGVIVPVKVDESTGNIVRDPKTGFASRESYEVGGEIIVKVSNSKIFPGYHRNEEATQKKFAHDVFQKNDLWYRSGDCLKRTADGRWFFLDRLGDTFRWKGENISTAEVAEVLGRYPGIIEANVYGVSLPYHDGRAGCAAIYIDPTLKPNFDFTDFLRYSRTHLPKYAVPLFLRIVKEMTPMHNNKQNKVPLRAEGIDPVKVNGDDEILWIIENGTGPTYEKLRRKDWEQFQVGKVRL
ncbi:Isopenicillin N epimerase component 1 [Podosphaera aphanis]|nr:Isopenicillin N epimerase component 1 [Podosphaera aphanis]